MTGDGTWHTCLARAHGAQVKSPKLGKGLAEFRLVGMGSAGPEACCRCQRRWLLVQVGTLRFDLNVLASAKTGKADKKKALELRKDFIKAVRAAPEHGATCMS